MDRFEDLEAIYQQHRLTKLLEITKYHDISVPDCHMTPLAILFILISERVPIPGELAGDLIPEFDSIYRFVSFWERYDEPLYAYKVYVKLDSLFKYRHKWIVPGRHFGPEEYMRDYGIFKQYELLAKLLHKFIPDLPLIMHSGHQYSGVIIEEKHIDILDKTSVFLLAFHAKKYQAAIRSEDWQYKIEFDKLVL
jgi:hypothetical protein